MLETLVDRQPALLIPLASILAAALVFLVWIMAYYWAAARRMELEANLKKDMLNRGMGAADIERVLLASVDHDPEQAPEKETVSDNEYYLVEKMLDNERPIEEIERLVRAFKSGDRAPLASLERVMADRGI